MNVIKNRFSIAQQSRIIEMAWDDKISFEAITYNYNCSENEVIEFMKSSLRSGSYRKWRQRVTGRRAKHLKRLTSNA